MSKLIKKLEDYRLEHKISQTKLAETLGVTFVTVNRWFNGKLFITTSAVSESI